MRVVRKSRPGPRRSPLGDPSSRPTQICRTPEETIQSLLSSMPELGSGGETPNEENKDQLLYRVLVLDPFLAELCASANSNKGATDFPDDGEAVGGNSKAVIPELVNRRSGSHGILTSETEIADSATDVETLLGKGLDEEQCGTDEALGILDGKDKDSLMEGGLGRDKESGDHEQVIGLRNLIEVFVPRSTVPCATLYQRG
ncbi:hypothetical protein U1Q18_042887 [Sarracenia purpurea var. burkii]